MARLGTARLNARPFPVAGLPHDGKQLPLGKKRKAARRLLTHVTCLAVRPGRSLQWGGSTGESRPRHVTQCRQ